MRKISNLIASSSLLIIAFSLPLLAAQAAPANPAHIHQLTDVDIWAVADTLKNMAGVAALVAAAVNLLKQVRLPNGNYLVEDGTAPAWSAGLNLLALIVIFVIKLQGNIDLLPAVDTQAGNLASMLNVILTYAGQLFATRQAHSMILAGLPGVGKSHSGRVAGESQVIDVTIPQA